MRKQRSGCWCSNNRWHFAIHHRMQARPLIVNIGAAVAARDPLLVARHRRYIAATSPRYRELSRQSPSCQFMPRWLCNGLFFRWAFPATVSSARVTLFFFLHGASSPIMFKHCMVFDTCEGI